MRVTSLLLSAFLILFVVLPEASGKPPGGHLNITQVFVDDPENPTSIMIIGEDLLFGPQGPSVTLGEFGALSIVGTPTDTLIEALLPVGIPDGDYLLTASGGNGQSQNDEYDLTIGAVGPQGIQGIQGEIGPQGETGPQGVQGPPGADGADGTDGVDGTDGANGVDGVNGADGATGSTGATGATGPQGDPGPQGGPGPMGLSGPQGEQGDQGEPGNLALAGLTCEEGEFLVGFTAAGGLLCAAIDGGGPDDPPDPVGEFDCADADQDGLCDKVACDANISLDDANPINGARAVGICDVTNPGTGFGLINAVYVRADGSPGSHSNQVGIMDSFGSNVVSRDGSRLLALGTGTARIPGQPDACGTASCEAVGAGTAPPFFPAPPAGCPVATDINDDVALELTLRAPTNAQGFSFDFSFYSFDYPESICTEFNDEFVALLSPPLNVAVNGNVAFDSQNHTISVNTGLFDVCVPAATPLGMYSCPNGTSELVATGFDIWSNGIADAGATGWLTTKVPVDGGQEFTLRFAIWDTGDQLFDSTVIIDNFQWIIDPTQLGTSH